MRHDNLAERSRGRWRSILLALGFDKGFLTGKHGPCPICGGADRFRFDDKGDGAWICNQCGSSKGIELVKRVKHVDFVEAAKMIETVIGAAEVDTPRDEPVTDQVARSLKMLSERSTPVKPGDAVSLYLSSRLGPMPVPACLRTVERCAYRDNGDKLVSYHPAMIASVRDPEGHAMALHRTYLTPDGTKAQVKSVRKVLGRLPDGCAVRLAEPAETMGIAEGIETALSAAQLFGIPTWAALNEGRLRTWQPPATVRKVIVFGDNDMNCIGQQAAYALAGRLRETIEAFVEIPPVIDTDWNDVLRTQRTAA